MNKIVCNVCGTSYPENAAQCPICGYAQTADSTITNNKGKSTYTYVKGGRFSKANVKKRNQAAANSSPVARSKKKNVKQQKSNIGYSIIIVLLLLAIVAVIAYIALRFFIPNGFLFEGFGGLKKPGDVATEPPVVSQEPSTEPSDPEPTVSLDCTAVTLNSTNLQLDGVGSSFELEITLEPADTPDAVLYTSSDETIAIVDENGVITAVGSGTATITVSCGSASADCIVECIDSAAEELTLNRKEITFNSEGDVWLLYDGDIPVDEIVWSVEDNQVAAIENGKVTAVGEGTTTVSGVYKDQSVSCIIHCKFEEDSDENSGEITEADGDSNRTFTLYNPYGYADDVTVNPGETFILKLVDENLKEPEGVEWSVKSEYICTFSDNVVKAVGSGMTEVTATYAGKTYSCTVRVN